MRPPKRLMDALWQRLQGDCNPHAATEICCATSHSAQQLDAADHYGGSLEEPHALFAPRRRETSSIIPEHFRYLSEFQQLTGSTEGGILNNL